MKLVSESIEDVLILNRGGELKLGELHTKFKNDHTVQNIGPYR